MERILRLANKDHDPFWTVSVPFCPACGQYQHPREVNLIYMDKFKLEEFLCRSCKQEMDHVMDRSPYEFVEK
jgi:hypothetical protein